MKILINRGNLQNAKSYPYWDELISLLKDDEVKEIKGIMPIKEIVELVNWCDVWLSIDSFLPHLCAYYKLKTGIVIWGKSDPELFGYKHNNNILKSHENLRKDQFRWWKDVVWNKADFYPAETILSEINKLRNE